MRQKEPSELTLHSSFNLAEFLNETYWRDDERNVYFCEVYPESTTFTNVRTYKVTSTDLDLVVLNDAGNFLTVLGFKSLEKVQI